jgi:hypothetical protein
MEFKQLFAGKKMAKKGMSWIMPTIIGVIALSLGLVGLAFSQAVGGKMLGQINNQMTAGTVEGNITADALVNYKDTAKWNPTISLVLIAGLLMSVIFSVLLGVFMGRR